MSRIREHRCLALLGLLVLSLSVSAASAGANCEEGPPAELTIEPKEAIFLVVGGEEKFTVKNRTVGDIKDLQVAIVVEEFFEIVKEKTTCKAELKAAQSCEVTVKCIKAKGKEPLQVASAKLMAMDSALLKS